MACKRINGNPFISGNPRPDRTDRKRRQLQEVRVREQLPEQADQAGKAETARNSGIGPFHSPGGEGGSA